MQKKLIVISILTFFLIISLSSANSNWSINDIDGPRSPMNVSNNTQTVQIIELVDGQGDPVNQSRLEDTDWDLHYNYSEPNSREDMEHLEGGYYYASFTANNSTSEIEYELYDESPNQGEVNTTETLNSDNLTLDIQDRFSKLKASESRFFEVNVTDENTGTSGDEATVYVSITNGTHFTKAELGYNNGLHTQSIEIPEYFNSDVVVHAYALSSDSPAKNGGESYLSEIFPKSTGHVDYLDSSSGCNNKSFFSSCERGAEIETGFNATPFDASEVTLHLKREKDDGTLEEVDEISMEKYDGLWNANYTFPDVNTSEYNKKLVTQYNATIDGTTFVKTRNISYKSFTIRDRSEATAFQGTSYDVEVLFGKFHSLSSLNTTRIESGNVSIYTEDGDSFENISLSEMDYSSDSGLFQSSIEIPSDAEQGNYDTEIMGTNIYGETKKRDSGFSVDSIDASFNVSDSDLDYDYNSTGIKEEKIKVTNRLNEPLEIEANYSSELENITTFNSNESLELGSSDTENVTLEFEIFGSRDWDGEITMTGNSTDYSKTLDVEIDGVECQIVNGSLCIDREDKWINLTATDVSSQTRTVTVEYLGETSSFVSTQIDGNVSDYLEIEPVSDTIFTETEFEMNYTPMRIGEFNGEIQFEGSENSLSMHTSFESEVENLEPSITTESFLSLSSVVSGNTVEGEITITNNGEVDVNSLSASSSTYDVSIEDTSIQAGEEADVNLTFNNIQSTSGSVEITGSTDEGNATFSISVSSNFLNYEQTIEDLNSRINSLQQEAEAEDIQSSLSDLSLDVAEAESQYQQGNTQEASEIVDSIEQELNTIETEIGQNSAPPNDDPNPGSGPGTGNESEDSNDEEGGSGILIVLVVVIFLIIVMAFVVYTSYIPEPGDPLYDLLGEE